MSRESKRKRHSWSEKIAFVYLADFILKIERDLEVGRVDALLAELDEEYGSGLA